MKIQTPHGIADIPDARMAEYENHAVLKNWGYWHRHTTSPFPRLVSATDVLAGMMPVTASTADREQDPAHDPDLGIAIEDAMSLLAKQGILLDLHIRCLWAYYVAYLHSVRQCCKMMPIHGIYRTKKQITDGVDRLSIRDFTKKLASAEGIVMGAYLSQ